jgi:uncharacterized protein
VTAGEESEVLPGRKVRVVVYPVGVGRRDSRRPYARRIATSEATPSAVIERPVPSDAAAVVATASIGHVLRVFAISGVLALLFGARGLLQSSAGMPDGPFQEAVSAVAHPLAAVTGATGITAPWDHLQSALGRTRQTTAPLLAGAPVTAPVRLHGTTTGHEPTEGKRPTVAAGAARPRVHALFVPTKRRPLRLLVTGDSLTEYMGPDVVDIAARVGPIRGFVDTHYGTGMVRPDFVDWSVVARQQVAADHPNAVVVMMGGNDFQNMTMPDGAILQASTPAWTREYQRRAAVCMRIWAQGGKARVYWLSMPPARDAAWTNNTAHIDIALRRAAAQVPGARYVNILGPVTNHGRYADFVDVNGTPTLVREPDGIHFNATGSAIVSQEVVSMLKREWHLGAQPKRTRHK